MEIALVVITDGRFDYLHETLTSLEENVKYKFASKTIVNDYGLNLGSESHAYLEKEYKEKGFKVISHKKRSGLTQAVRTAWESVPYGTDFVFHLEEDFTFNEPIDIELFSEILKCRPHLTQMLLKRQPWGDQEPAFGGYVEMDPDAYEEHKFLLGDVTWCEHRKFFSLNPCLIPRWVTDLGWHDDNERGFTAQLFSDPNAMSGLFGAKFDAPKVHHIGIKRTHEGGDSGYGIPHLP